MDRGGGLFVLAWPRVMETGVVGDFKVGLWSLTIVCCGSWLNPARFWRSVFTWLNSTVPK